ncbi:MAG: glycosyltransferase family 4 protein [Acidobacteriota bacterium]|nr:glycosyltransferase family 4 protein [Acidobacteriota bacterium]
MRVLQLGPVPPPHGGVQANLSALAERLRFFGHDCQTVAITRSSEIKPQANVYHPENAQELFKLLFSLKYDIAHLHFGGDFTGRLAALAFVCGILPGKKTVLTFHSGGFASSEDGKRANKFSFRGFAVRRLDKIIAVNEEIKNLFLRYGVRAEKIEIIAPHFHRQPNPNAEIPEKIERFFQQHSYVLLATATLEKHYDLSLQIRALENVLKEFPNCGLLIAGSGELESELKQQISETGYAENIMLAGDVPHETVLHLIKRADALVRTTLFDGDAISVREALFLETPVIATDNKMRPSGVRLMGIGDGSGLTDAILAVLRAGKKQKGNKSNDWSNIDAVIRVYEDLLKPKSISQISQIQNLKSKI